MEKRVKFSHLNYRSLLHEHITLSGVLQEDLWMRFVTVKLEKEGYSMFGPQGRQAVVSRRAVTDVRSTEN